jgi:hypothetical protein
MIWSWGPCGAQEAGVVYEVASGARRILGWQDFINEDGSVTQFPIYSDFALSVVVVTPEQQAAVPDEALAPGEVQFVQVTAVDPAGNRDTGECADD